VSFFVGEDCVNSYHFDFYDILMDQNLWVITIVMHDVLRYRVESTEIIVSRGLSLDISLIAEHLCLCADERLG
jgi:hypothetical protein